MYVLVLFWIESFSTRGLLVNFCTPWISVGDMKLSIEFLSCVLIDKELILLQDWKTERYKEIIKSGTVRTSGFIGRKVFCFLFF